MTRQRPPGEADERAMLTGRLDWRRAPPVPHASLNRLLDRYDALRELADGTTGH
jgi:hypothetical protein